MLKYPVFEENLKELKKQGLLRAIRDRESPQGRTIILDGKEYINFASNDYLGLSNHPKTIKAAADALRAYGLGAGASRLLSGGCTPHGELEEKLASFKGTEAALLFNSGYAANTGIIPAIASNSDGKGPTALFSDELNHASIIDGCNLSKVKTSIYRHKDMTHLESLLKKSNASRKIVVTDTVFSMDGSIAPLDDLYRICQNCSALLYLDDAHGTGVLGGHSPLYSGKGALSHFGLNPANWVIQMGTLSKAFGSFGAFVAGTQDVIDWLKNTSRSFMFSTALPSPVIAASLAALEIIENDDILIKRLWDNRERLFNALKAFGLDTGNSETPIIPILMKDVEAAMNLSKRLFDKGIYAPAIRPPTVKQPRIRLTVTVSHTEKDIDRLSEALRALLG